MGAAESTTRTNATKEEEEERQRASSGSSTAAGAAMALAAVGVAAWGISRMVSENTEKDDEMKMKGTLMEAQSYGLPSPVPYSREEYGVGAGGSNPRTGWCPPPLGRYKMNTDASCLQDLGQPGSNDHSFKFKKGPSGFAGVLRDHRGKWVQAFHGFIGESDSFTAELSGIYYGLLLLDKRGLKEATLESDCNAAIEWIKQENNSNSRRSPIINKNWETITNCKRLVAKNRITVSYCSRDSNKLADKLADLAIAKQDEYKDITVIPAGEIQRIVDQESNFA